MSVCTSGTSSIVMMFPLSFVVYLLIADWDKPRISAACLSFIPCLSTIALAISALIAGKTVLTPTSHGSSNLSPIILFLLETYISMTHVIYFMTRVMTGLSLKDLFCTQSLTPLPVRTHVNKGKGTDGHEAGRHRDNVQKRGKES